MVIVGSIVFYPLGTKEFTLQIKKATTHHEQPLHKLPCFNLYT